MTWIWFFVLFTYFCLSTYVFSALFGISFGILLRKSIFLGKIIRSHKIFESFWWIFILHHDEHPQSSFENGFSVLKIKLMRKFSRDFNVIFGQTWKNNYHQEPRFSRPEKKVWFSFPLTENEMELRTQNIFDENMEKNQKFFYFPSFAKNGMEQNGTERQWFSNQKAMFLSVVFACVYEMLLKNNGKNCDECFAEKDKKRKTQD